MFKETKQTKNSYHGNDEIALEATVFSKKYRECKKYPAKDASWRIYLGKFHELMVNWAGKTTIIKLLIGAYAKHDGNVKFSAS